MRNRRNWIALASAGALLVVALLRTFPPGKSAMHPRTQTDTESHPQEAASKIRTRTDGPILSGANQVENKPRKSTQLSRPTASSGASDAFPDEAKDALTFVYDPEQSFKDAEKEFGVPANVLKAIAQVESRGEHNNGYANERGGRGLMGLTDTPEHPMLERATQLLGAERRSLILDPVQNIRAAAALMRFYNNGAVGSRSWTKALTRYSGRSGDEAARYVSNIRKLLTDGAAPVDTASSDLTIPPGQQGLLDEAETN